MAILQLGSLPTLAQVQGDLDYYAPRTTAGEKQHYYNVVNNHIPPGKEEFANRRYAASVAHAEFVLRYFPNEPQALSLLSESCLKWRHPKCDSTADEWFQRAIARNPGAPLTYMVYASHLRRNEHLKEAVDAYRRAVALAPQSVTAHYNLGLAYIDLKEYDLANQQAQKSYQLGAPLPGLRTRLEKLGKWNPSVSMPSDASSASEAKPASDAKPDDHPAPPAKQAPDESILTK